MLGMKISKTGKIILFESRMLYFEKTRTFMTNEKLIFALVEIAPTLLVSFCFVGIPNDKTYPEHNGLFALRYQCDLGFLCSLLQP